MNSLFGSMLKRALHISDDTPPSRLPLPLPSSLLLPSFFPHYLVDLKEVLFSLKFHLVGME